MSRDSGPPDEPEMSGALITLLTDFGDRDTFVGQMKGVLLSWCPGATLVDLTHKVSPQSIIEAGLHLSAAWASFPAGTVHLAVVDPGVGTERRAIALTFRGQHFILPDNGLISPILRDEVPDDAVQIALPDPREGGISRTFHGRDVFAPAAGKLACGANLADLGNPIDPATIVRLELPVPRQADGVVHGEIVLIDHFGNAITNIPASMLADPARQVVACGNFFVRRVSLTYGDVPVDTPVALVSSMGTLELSVRDGSAADRYALTVGMTVRVSAG